MFPDSCPATENLDLAKALGKQVGIVEKSKGAGVPSEVVTEERMSRKPCLQERQWA